MNNYNNFILFTHYTNYLTKSLIIKILLTQQLDWLKALATNPIKAMWRKYGAANVIKKIGKHYSNLKPTVQKYINN